MTAIQWIVQTVFLMINSNSGENTAVSWTLTFPLSNLLLYVSDLPSCLSPESPYSPYMVMNTLASVPAPLTSPVKTWTLYFRTANETQAIKLKMKLATRYQVTVSRCDYKVTWRQNNDWGRLKRRTNWTILNPFSLKGALSRYLATL